MAIKIIPEETVEVSQGEYDRYLAEYSRAYRNYAGTPPSLEEFIRRKKREMTEGKGSGRYSEFLQTKEGIVKG